MDPGVTTGYVLAEVRGGEYPLDATATQTFEGVYLHVIEAEQPRLDPRDVLKLLRDLNPDEVVCESFEFRQGKAITGADLTPKEIIGAVKAWGLLTDKPVYFQTAAVGKGYFKDDKLREADMWFVGKAHARDAARHLLYWFNFGAGSRFWPEQSA